ncbi:hypothetical protein O9G_000187 [Rozella allomycis CSF55]|uniref:Uncharacterized protein n=1 Tax=Rozella allomycis (strain CSF55) TaxID=988480 RepID=A0A075AT70_ROZAC|nr:hypothetical protein O9G_000187 [Rozella allomycis CSF55]|eukprot:EPZ31708.1 hypothetical protein O9G_000187 [Rozella allomycis CSF55]
MSPPDLIPTHKAIADKFALTFYKRDDYEALRFECLREMDCDLKPHSQEFRELDKKVKGNLLTKPLSGLVSPRKIANQTSESIWARADADVRAVVDKDVFDSIAVADMDTK